MYEAHIARMLTNRYNDKTLKCVDQKKNEHPAFACSGILIRGVRDIPNTLEYPWMFKKRNKDKNSFSMAFLRRDAPFSTFPSGYDSGFIIFPHLKTPRIKNTYQVFCAFPVDGHTDGRAGLHACGKSQRKDDPNGSSDHCDTQGITTYNKWIKHYSSIKNQSGYFIRRQCAFDMTIATAPQDFGIVLQANAYIRKQKRYSFRNNELLIQTWNEKKPQNIPIEAFFYLIDVPNTLSKAKRYQNDYLKLTGEEIPIVGIRLPTPTNMNITIEYVPRPG